MRRFVLGLAFVLLGCPHSGGQVGSGERGAITLDPAEVSGADIRWYDVSGHDVLSLRESLRAAAPLDEHAEHVIGDTQWNATWTWKGEGEPCRVARADVDLSLLVWLPRWTPEAGTQPEVVERWRAYLAALALHERGHVDLVNAEVEQLDDMLRAAACEDADAVGEAALEAIRSLNHEYDARTQHGKLQGATFWTAADWGAAIDDQAGFAE